MDGFTVEGKSTAWEAMFEAATKSWPKDEQTAAHDLLVAARKLANNATDALKTRVEDVDDPNVRVIVLADDGAGGFGRMMLDVYVTP
jgi:hypothetical protein